jgi:hypothetical protein
VTNILKQGNNRYNVNYKTLSCKGEIILENIVKMYNNELQDMLV